MVIKRLFGIVAVTFFVLFSTYTVNSADVYNTNCGGSCTEYPSQAAAATAAASTKCTFNLSKSMLPLKVIKGTCASIAPKTYYCICELPIGCKDKLTQAEASDLCSKDPTCGATPSGPHYGTCPAGFIKKYKCICPAGDVNNPTKTKCTSYPNNTATPKTCSFTKIKGCENTVPIIGECTAADSSEGAVLMSTSDLLTMGKQMNPANINSPEVLIARIIKIALQSVGVITLGFFIYGGTLYMVSGGNAEQQGKAIKILVWTTLGVVVISGAYMFVNYIFTKIIH